VLVQRVNEVVGYSGVQRMTSTEALEDSCKSAKESGVKLERADELGRVVRSPCLYSKAELVCRILMSQQPSMYFRHDF
jgi:hypothetical protein